MSGTPPAASTLALSSLETWGGDCGVVVASARPLLGVPLLGAFLPPNQPMIYCLVSVARSCGESSGGVLLFGEGLLLCSTPPAFVYCLNGLVSMRFGAALAPTAVLAQSTAPTSRACWLWRNADAHHASRDPFPAVYRRCRSRGSMLGML